MPSGSLSNISIQPDGPGTSLGPAATTASTVSDYLGYGSYSGADIKVVVHYPSTIAVQKLAEKRKTDLNSELNEALSQYNTILRNNSGPEALQEARDRVNIINQQLENVDASIKEAENLPTSKVLAELQTISWSTHRDVVSVRTLGSVYPRAETLGPRTIAGSMIFTMFHEHVLHEILDLNLGVYNTGTSDHDPYLNTTNLPDQLPPLDMSIVCANEYGAVSYMGLYGVKFVQEGGTFSIQDIFSESVVQYKARDIDPLRIAGIRKLDGQGVTDTWKDSASGLLYKKQQEDDHLRRRNPFI